MKHKEVRVVFDLVLKCLMLRFSIARSKMKEYKLEDTKLVVLQGMNNEAVDVTSIRAMVMEDFYKNSEQRLQQQAVKISQLETTLEQYRTYDAMSRTLVPRIEGAFILPSQLFFHRSLARSAGRFDEDGYGDIGCP